MRTSTVRFPDTETYAAQHHRRAAGERVATYGRHGTETHRALEAAVCALEGGHESFLAPSGLSAIVMVFLGLLSAGDHALVADNVYAPVRRTDKALLQRFGITVDYFRPGREPLAQLVRPNTRLVYLESPSSLLFEVIDLPALAQEARALGLIVAVDNTWSGGLFYRPLSLGAHLSVQAATKYLAGHSDVMQGVVTVDSPALGQRIQAAYDALGLSVGADDAYLVLRGVRTLEVRLTRHFANALQVAEALAGHPAVARVYYPALPSDPGHAVWRRDFTGASGLVSFALRSPDPSAGARVIDALALFGLGASWGGYESLALEAAPERLAEHGCWDRAPGAVIRLHVGLEHPQDLIADVEQALRRL